MMSRGEGRGAAREKRRRPHVPDVATAVFVLGLAALVAATGFAAGEGGMEFSLRSSAFASGKSIPALHTCDGVDVSPPLSWSGLPAGAKSLALIVDDPDAPDPAKPKMTWVHWVLYNIPPTAEGLPQGVRSDGLPTGTLEGKNDWGRKGYGGPCPPVGRHRYYFKLYALDSALPDLGAPTKAELERAMANRVLSRVELVGTYQRSR